MTDASGRTPWWPAVVFGVGMTVVGVYAFAPRPRATHPPGEQPFPEFAAVSPEAGVGWVSAAVSRDQPVSTELGSVWVAAQGDLESLRLDGPDGEIPLTQGWLGTVLALAPDPDGGVLVRVAAAEEEVWRISVQGTRPRLPLGAFRRLEAGAPDPRQPALDGAGGVFYMASDRLWMRGVSSGAPRPIAEVKHADLSGPAVNEAGSLAWSEGSQIVVVQQGERRVLGEGRDPAWSSDGAHLFAWVNDSDVGRLIRYELASGALLELEVPGRRPAASPSGHWIAYETADQRIGIARPDGTSAQAVTAADRRCSQPRFEQDGWRLGYVCEAPPGADIYAVELGPKRTRGTEHVITVGNRASVLGWSWHGEWIAFALGPEGGVEARGLWTVRLEEDE